MEYFCRHCGRTGSINLDEISVIAGPVRCARCSCMVTAVCVSECEPWIETQVRRKRELQQQGKLQTRIQTGSQSDTEIDRDGLEAELAACAILCPVSLERFKAAIQVTGPNRGRDLKPQWTGLAKGVEIKYTKYRSETKGFLFLRPPSRLGPEMKEAFVDDAIYVLVQPDPDEPRRKLLAGWIDRSGFLKHKKNDPVGRRPGQLNTWGVHWSDLYSLERILLPAGAYDI